MRRLMKKFISRQCQTEVNTYLIRQLKMPTPAYHILLPIDMGKQSKKTPWNTSIQVTETIKYVKAITTS